MKHTEHGFILVAVLALLSMLMLLSVTQWQAIVLLQRFIHQDKREIERILDFEEAFRVIWQQTSQAKVDGLMTWHGQTLHYLVQPLGVFPCIHLVINGEHYSTWHGLISLSWLDNPKVHLEIRAAKAIPKEPCSDEWVREVRSEILSWNDVKD